jgi:predicted transcriptional regulator
MNTQAGLPESFAPPPLRKLTDTGLTIVMMRDILLKTVFRKNVENASEIAAAVALPTPLAQELIDMLREMGLMQATGTLHATSSNEMGYQLTDGGKARALDALSQSEYYGAMPVPLEAYKEQVKRQSIKQRPDHTRDPGGVDGQSDPARRHDRSAWAGGDLGSLGPDVRPAGQR